MTRKENGSGGYQALMRREATDYMTRADAAMKRRQFTRAYHLYGEAIARLELLWDTTGSRSCGDDLVEAYRNGAYPASRRFYQSKGLNKFEKHQWQLRFEERFKLAVQLELRLLEGLPKVGIHKLVGVQCHLLNLAGAEQQLQNLEDARHCVAEMHRIQKDFGPADDTIHPSLQASSELILADCLVDEGHLSQALSCADKAIELEQSYIDFRRAQKRKKPFHFMEHVQKRRAEIFAMIPESNDMEKPASK